MSGSIKVVTIGKVGPTGAGVGTHEAISNTLMHVRQCTSSTRPTSPIEGQVIFETDTDRFRRYDGTTWRVFGQPQAGCLAYRNGAVNLANDTLTTISLDAETFDTDSFHDNSVNPSRLTVPAGLGGLYIITGQFAYGAHATGQRRCQLTVGGARKALTTIEAVDSGGTWVQASKVLRLVDGDYVEMAGQQNSGASLAVTVGSDIDTFLSLARIGE